ncbi:acetylglucosamine-6-sulfatase [Ktedonobacter sp. SOSP1-52]|uniref:sulfatase-like hydrolase/transferase n=1 Tax=Ktedonobacter sp. SOSP1-52 TaxID=2778366 RepID=UPI0019155574|nr:sulfatase-like hydrolase/transferase [Ktedonobacter sp. SOSP1-52]GHO63841.1 acetylglucosamine-6-sulfatase [Ktedonobacter sp. SOSP1-52]
MTQATKRPNVIVFFTDQQRWDTSSLHGNPLQLTPNFDRFAQRGTHVTSMFTCQPVCGPARSIMQSGLYPTTTGCYRNNIPLPLETRTLAHAFKDAGYTTGYIGKWHLGSADPVVEDERGGYDYWLASNILEFTSRPYDTVVYNNENQAVKLPGYRVDAITDAAIRYVDQHQREPFFLFISQLEPHQQNQQDYFPAPDGYEERYRGAWMPPDLAALGGSAHQHLPGYFGQVKRVDEAFGRLLEAVKSLGMEDNTIILFTSDHGCHFKTRNSEYKRSCHESSIRVLAAFQGPGFHGGRRIEELVSLVDLPPTLIDAAGLPIPPAMQGNSLLKLIRNGEADWPQEVLIQVSESQVGRALRTKNWKYGVVAPDKNGWHDSHAEHYIETYLYDLEADPYELNNLAGKPAHREIAHGLKELLVSRMVEAGEKPCLITEPE